MTQQPAFLSRFTPSLMPQEALEGIFVQRHDLAQEIMERIRTCAFDRSQQHTFLIGPRGIGKTHLISLIYYRLRAMADVRERMYLAWLREEEWEITTFLDLLLRILHALIAEIENDEVSAQRINALYNLPAEKAEIAATEILQELLQGRTLLILMENLDELLQGIGPDGRRHFDRFMRVNPHFLMLASSQSPLDDALLPGGTSFPGIRHFHQLEELTHEDAMRLLVKIANYRGDRKLSDFITTPRGLGRMRALKYLAGGNHRAYVIFSQFLTRDSLDELIEPLMRTIDDLTPYYQARMAWLSPQQRKIIAFICEWRHPMPVKEIARRCFMKPENATTHLEALRKIGHLHSFAVGADRYYELREPLMRLSIEVKKHRGKPVRLLVDFLRLWYSPAELRQRLASLPADAALERAYVQPALEVREEEGEHPRVPICCAEYKSAVEKSDFPRALRAAEELVALRGRPEDLSVLGFCLRSLGRHEEAVACYDKMIAFNPKDALAWMLRGSALSKLGRCEEALDSCDQAIELNPQEARAWSDRGAILLNTGHPDQALASFEKATQLDPDDSFAWIYRGISLSDLSCYEEASASFAKAAEIDPFDEMPYVYRCAALIELKHFEQALEHAERALEIAPDQPLAWAVRGTAQAALEHYRDALISTERAIELGEQSAFVFFKHAEILFAEDRWQEGSTALGEALNRFYRSDNPDAGNTTALIRILQRMLHDEKGLQLRIKVLILVYYKYGALAALAHALVECIPDLFSPVFQELTARRWLDLWRSLAGSRPEFRLPLRLLDSAVSYRQTRDLRVLMELPLEERVLLEPLLGVKVQATA